MKNIPLRARAAVAAASVAAFAAACGSPTTPPVQPAGLTVISGGGVTDTAAAFLSTPLVVQVRDSAGELRAGIDVVFHADTATRGGGLYAGALVSGVALDDYRMSTVATTDATGRAVARVRLGIVAGPSRVWISAPTLGLSGSAAFTITPGATARVTVMPQDTAVYVGASYSVRLAAQDRWGNELSATPATVASAGTGVASASGNTVTGVGVGRTALTVSAGGSTTTVGLSVVPEGTLLAAAQDGIYLFDMNGANFRRVVHTPEARSPRWFPGGERFVYTTGYIAPSRVSDLHGTTRPLVAGANPLVGEVWAHPSHDGQWVYFGGYDQRYRGYPYRVRANGTAMQLVPGFTPDDRTQSHPSTSPSGDLVAYFHEAAGNSRDVTLRIRSVTTGELLVSGIRGHSPEWSHGDSIAYLDPQGGTVGPIRLMSSEGRGHRAVGDGTTYEFGIDWSPDDQWIVARDDASDRIELVRRATGQRIPLPFTAGLRDPAWRP